jgi:hypothetical protein
MSKPIRFLLELWVRSVVRDKNIGPWVQKEIQLLGPVYVKIGQILGTRNDLPPEIMAAFENLQDKAEGQITDLHDDMTDRYNSNLVEMTNRIVLVQVLLLVVLRLLK